jgi:hypothetical protein
MATMNPTISEIAKKYLVHDSIDVAVDEIVILPCCRPVTTAGVNKLVNSFQTLGITLGNRIALHQLSPADAATYNARYSIIDGAHRVLALRQLREVDPDRWPPMLNAAV